MNLRQLYLTKNECYHVYKLQTPKSIMVHSTGANNPWLSRYIAPDDGLIGKNLYDNDWNRYHPGGRDIGPHTFVKGPDGKCTECGGVQKCVSAFIGKLKDGTVATIQTLPWDCVSWHSGVGDIGNVDFISFEICEDDHKSSEYFNNVYKEAVELCAYLCRKFNIAPDYPNIICHSEGYKLGIASNHADVMHWFPKFGKSMDTFRGDVKKQIEEEIMEEKWMEFINKLIDKTGKTEDEVIDALAHLIKYANVKEDEWEKEGTDYLYKESKLINTPRAANAPVHWGELGIVLKRLEKR